MSAWILVILFSKYGSMTSQTIVFPTQQDCLNAAKAISVETLDGAPYSKFVCVKQGTKP